EETSDDGILGNQKAPGPTSPLRPQPLPEFSRPSADLLPAVSILSPISSRFFLSSLGSTQDGTVRFVLPGNVYRFTQFLIEFAILAPTSPNFFHSSPDLFPVSFL
ncbi:unnamed protein product, partial [Ixodes pacificus]